MQITNVGPMERFLSVAAGAALLRKCANRSGVSRGLLGAASLELIRRGVSGRSYAYQFLGIGRRRSNGAIPYELGVPLQDAITINRDIEEVYSFWRNLSNLPAFMERLREITVEDNTHSRWVMRGPGDSEVAWNAEIHNEVKNELLAWRTTGPSDVNSAGSVRFRPAAGGRGTQVIVKLQYDPPGGQVGVLASHLLGFHPGRQLREDLKRLKTILEIGLPGAGGNRSGDRRPVQLQS
jgi:uncharacterized membrane protein